MEEKYSNTFNVERSENLVTLAIERINIFLQSRGYKKINWYVSAGRLRLINIGSFEINVIDRIDLDYEETIDSYHIYIISNNNFGVSQFSKKNEK